MNPAAAPRLAPATSGFVLAAAITVLFNTALAWAKDASPPLNDFMKSLTGHHWTTHGLADLVLFLGLGFVFANSNFVQRIVQKMDSNRLTQILIAAVAAATLGLALWFAFV